MCPRALAEPVAPRAPAYNVPQRLAYSAVVFALFPLVIWTGLAKVSVVDKGRERKDVLG